MIERQLARSSRCWNKWCKNVELDRLQPCTVLQAHLPFTNEKFLCARRRISPSKYTRKPMTRQQEPEGEKVCRGPPRMVSLRSSGMPAHRWLLPSTMVRHSSRAACSASAPEGRRCASNALKASKVVPGGAGGIKRTRRERMSPARRYRKCGTPVMRLQLAVSLLRYSTSIDGGKRREKIGLPMEGPPSTRMISLDEPPLSDTGRT